MSDRDSLDMFLGDMAAHQTAHVGEVTAEANRAIAVPLFEQMDQKDAAESHRIAPPIAIDPTPDVRASDIEAKKRGYRFAREMPVGEIVVLTPRQRAEANALHRRLELLLASVESGPLGAPSWAARVKAIFAEQLHDPRKRTLVAHKINALCRESEAVFGPVFAPRVPTLFGGAAR